MQSVHIQSRVAIELILVLHFPVLRSYLSPFDGLMLLIVQTADAVVATFFPRSAHYVHSTELPLCVCLSVCLCVTLMICGHIGWVTSKVIIRIIVLAPVSPNIGDVIQ